MIKDVQMSVRRVPGTALPMLAARWAAKVWSDSDLVCVLSAIAAVKGHPAIAEAVIEMTDLNAADMCEWLRER
jgi:hypothetical protein